MLRGINGDSAKLHYYLRTLKEINDIESEDESVDIEAGKTLSAKLSSQRIAFTHGELI